MVVEILGAAGLAAPLIAALILMAEAGLLVGLVLPGISVPVALGVLDAVGVVGTPWAVGAAVLGAVVGPNLGFQIARRRHESGRDPLVGLRRSPAALRTVTRIQDRPILAVTVGQCFAVARTLAPRLVAQRMSAIRFALLNAPAAILWCVSAFGLGHVLARGSQVASSVLATYQVLGVLALVVVVAVGVLSGVRLVRSAHR